MLWYFYEELIPTVDLICFGTFYEELIPTDRSTIDAASSGALVSKTPTETRQLISTMAKNAQQFRMQALENVTSTTQEVNELRAKLVELSSLVTQAFSTRA